MPEPIRKLGPYTLVSKIGLGGFGVVWLAEKRTAIATTQFALKLPRGEDIDLEAFKQEAAIWIQASGHPNVLPLIDADPYDDQVVIVSKYVPDGSLAGWLKQHGGKAASAEAAVEIMDGVLAGLALVIGNYFLVRSDASRQKSQAEAARQTQPPANNGRPAAPEKAKQPPGQYALRQT